MELEQLLIGISAQAALLVETEKGTVTTMQSAPKTLSVETITVEISGIRQNQQRTHRLYKWLICHLGVIFFVYGPIFFLKKVLKTLADFATHGHVSKEQIFFSFF